MASCGDGHFGTTRHVVNFHAYMHAKRVLEVFITEAICDFTAVPMDGNLALRAIIDVACRAKPNLTHAPNGAWVVSINSDTKHRFGIWLYRIRNACPLSAVDHSEAITRRANHSRKVIAYMLRERLFRQRYRQH